MQNYKVIGVDLGGTNVRVGKIQGNQITDFYAQKISSDSNDAKIVIDEVISSIEKVIDTSVIGIGIGVPSVIDIDEGVVYEVQNIPSWKRVPLKSILEEKFNIPVAINNDANCFVAGEKYFGKGKSYENIVGLIIGTGLGAGLVLNNRLYSGTNCGAGEFGMIEYRDSIYEKYCCGQYFKDKYLLSGEEIFKMAQQGEQEALDIFKEFGVHIGNAIKTILFSADPEIIILGGSVSKAFQYFKDSMIKTLASFPYSIMKNKLHIEVSEIDNIAVLGAAAIYYEAAKSEFNIDLKVGA